MERLQLPPDRRVRAELPLPRVRLLLPHACETVHAHAHDRGTVDRQHPRSHDAAPVGSQWSSAPHGAPRCVQLQLRSVGETYRFPRRSHDGCSDVVSHSVLLLFVRCRFSPAGQYFTWSDQLFGTFKDPYVTWPYELDEKQLEQNKAKEQAAAKALRFATQKITPIEQQQQADKQVAQPDTKKAQ